MHGLMFRNLKANKRVNDARTGANGDRLQLAVLQRLHKGFDEYMAQVLKFRFTYFPEKRQKVNKRDGRLHKGVGFAVASGQMMQALLYLLLACKIMRRIHL